MITAPFSVVFEPNLGTVNPPIPVRMRSGTWVPSRMVPLGPGAYLVQVSWNGPGQALLRHRRLYQQTTPVTTVATAATATVGVPAVSQVVQVSAAGEHYLSVDLSEPASQATVDARYVATITVYPVPAFGG